MLDQLIPGYKDKLWARYPPAVKKMMIASENDGWEKPWAELRSFQPNFLKYKDMEKSWKPSFKYRKPVVDWPRMLERGTMHTGRWYEGPNGSDYTPGNTVDRLADVKAPFSAAEWEERKQYRSFDLLTFGGVFLAGFVYYRVSTEWPVVWCEEETA
jgi:ubiquinol-cytochrome c reductase cytochrome c1 subunit